jgi:hypothetical protein
MISLSGPIFSASVVNITNATTSTALPGDGGAPVGAMTTGTIVGIAVGCVLAFISAFGLFFIYFRKKRQQGLKIESPPPDAPGNGGHFYSIGNGHITNSRQQTKELPRYNNKQILSHNRSMSNAQFYDKLESDRQQALNYYQVPPARGFGLQTSLPAHAAYIPKVVSRPAAPTAQSALNSYPLQPYNPSVAGPKIDFNFATLNSVAPNAIPSNIVTQEVNDSRSSSRQEFVPPPPPPPPPPAASKVPSLSLPSLAKFKMPKKYVPPNLMGPSESTPAIVEPKDPAQSELAISKPLAVLEARFQDKPLQGGQVLATEAPAYFTNNRNDRQQNKSPMLSGNTVATVKSDATRILW